MVLPGIDSFTFHHILYGSPTTFQWSANAYPFYILYICVRVSFQIISMPPFFLRPSSQPSVTLFKIDQNKIQNRLTPAIEFCYKIVDFSLEKLETIKLILFLIQEPPRRPNFPKQVTFLTTMTALSAVM